MSIYYIHAADLDMVKIGYAKDIAKRASMLRVGSPIRLDLLAVEDGSMDDEKKRHRQFADFRVRGEWFRHDGALRDHISLLEPYVAPPKPKKGRLVHSSDMDITATRKAMGLSKPQLAEKLGVAPSTVYRLESGEMPLTRRMEASLRVLCDNYGIKNSED